MIFSYYVIVVSHTYIVLQRGRSALVYCIDRRDGDVTMEMVYALLDKGIDIAMRDNV